MQYMVYEKDRSDRTQVFFEDRFYRGEFRCGFFVSSVMKRAWAEQIEILSEVDRICKKYGIKYFADSGTLLGAVRHKGFIPWDDDLDIAMLRGDYEKFLSVCDSELKKEYSLLRPYERNDFDQTFIRIVNDKGLNEKKDDLSWCHGFEFFAGVDIFPLDYLAKDPEEAQIQITLAGNIDNARCIVRSGVKDENREQLENILNQIELLCHVSFDCSNDLEKQLGRLFEKICTLYREEECDEITIFANLQNYPEYIFKKEWYQETILLDFESVKIPAPKCYHEILQTVYGDYREFVRGTATHNYPYYVSQIKAREKEYCKELCREVRGLLASVLDVPLEDIKNLEVIKSGIRNQTVRFQVAKEWFAMRVVRVDRNQIVTCPVEEDIYHVLKEFEITDLLCAYSKVNGNKITSLIQDSHGCDVNDWEEVSQCLQVLKFVHQLEVSVDYQIDLQERIELFEKLWTDESYFSDYLETKEKIWEMYQYACLQEQAWGLTHFEPAADNFLIVKNSRGETDIRLIDWELAGMQDTHIDIAMFALNASYSRKELDRLVDLYFDNGCKREIRLKIYCYMAICALFYSNYYEYFDRCGIEMNEKTLKYYQIAKDYYDIWKVEKDK